MIDKKSSVSSKMIEKLDATLKKSSLFYVPSVDIRWGGYSLIKAEMKLFEISLKKEYDYYHLISGSDLPIENVKKLILFLKKKKINVFYL